MHDEDRAVATKFDQLAREGFMAEFQPDERPRLDAHLARWALKPGQRVLEPGCGTGRLTEVLAKRVGPAGEVSAFDISAEMIAMAGRRDCGVQTTFEVGDGRTLKQPDRHFDRIICFQVFPHFVHREEVLREFRRVLKPDGVLWIAHLIGREKVNAVHRRSSPPLNTHLLPDDATLRAVLATAGFGLRDVIDDAHGFSACGVLALD